MQHVYLQPSRETVRDRSDQEKATSREFTSCQAVFYYNSINIFNNTPSPSQKFHTTLRLTSRQQLNGRLFNPAYSSKVLARKPQSISMTHSTLFSSVHAIPKCHAVRSKGHHSLHLASRLLTRSAKHTSSSLEPPRRPISIEFTGRYLACLPFSFHAFYPNITPQTRSRAHVHTYYVSAPNPLLLEPTNTMCDHAPFFGASCFTWFIVAPTILLPHTTNRQAPISLSLSLSAFGVAWRGRASIALLRDGDGTEFVGVSDGFRGCVGGCVYMLQEGRTVDSSPSAVMQMGMGVFGLW